MYSCKILRHGTAPCLRMMKTLALSQSQGIRYKVTHNHLNRFLLSSGSLGRYYQASIAPSSSSTILPIIQVQITLHQWYIKVHLGLISGVCMLPHQFSHHRRIFHCKPLPLHPYRPWRSPVPLGELRSSAEGQVPFL